MWSDRLKALAESSAFQNFITGTILLAGGVVGLETYPSVVDAHGGVLHVMNTVILWIFVAEIGVKMGAEGRAPWRYFRDGWNGFDFVIVAGSFLPFAGEGVTVLRLLRLLRVLKLVKALPRLQILVNALLKSIPSMGYVSLLLGLLFYIYAVAGVFLFGANDPFRFADLPTAMLSLFRTVTLESWGDAMYTNMYGCDRYGYDESSLVACTNPAASPILSVLFFVSFVLFGTMIMLNLFIGVIMSGMSEAQKESDALRVEEDARRGIEAPPLDEMEAIEHQVREIEEALGLLRERLAERRRASANDVAKAS